MKLYLSDLNLSNIKIDNIEKYITSKDIIIELYSNEGIFVCKNHTGFKKLDIIDGDVKIIENYIEQLNLYIDETFIYKSKQLASRIPVNNKRKLLTKYETPFEGILNNWLNDEFIGIPSIDHSIKTLPPVNLIESKESYTIELSAPGFDKDDFKIELDNFNLSVSLDIDDKMNEAIQYTKREYNYSSFKRSFKLAKYSDIKKIDASYVNGILTIQIPKTKEAIPLPVKSIKIS